MTTLWAREAADRFWANAGGVPAQYPRDLRRAVAWALPLAVVDLPRLGVGAVDAWLRRHHVVGVHLATHDRPLRACLLAYGGAGVVLLDGADADEERRFSLAHEVAHFLVEYALPRERTAHRVGLDALAVLDGHRAPTVDERVDAVLSGASLQAVLHLMERTPHGHPPLGAISQAERRADDLALELLAPAEAVTAILREGEATTAREAAALVASTFGLPAPVARMYTDRLWPGSDESPDGSLAERLGLGRSPSCS